MYYLVHNLKAYEIMLNLKIKCYEIKKHCFRYVEFVSVLIVVSKT